ncbi:MAG: hypothetical protein AAF478_12535 [Pseudomonadota bacterium]
MFRNLLLAGLFGFSTLVIPIPVSTADASPAIFETITGKWRGKGLVKASPKGKKEAIRCRMNNKPDNKDGRINIGGNCAVGGFVFSLNGFIQQNDGKNSYTASMFRSLANLKQSNFSGKRNGKRINFSFKARDRVSKQDIAATIILNAKNDKAMDIDISRTDPGTGKVFKVGVIKFSKR